MRKEVLEKLWLHEIKILDEIDRICKKHNITYFLFWGTLIGAVRHKGFIPWDDDIDLGMPIEDYKKFIKAAKKELSDEFFLQTNKTDKYHTLTFAKVRLNNTVFCEKNCSENHMGIFVDIIPLYRYDEASELSKKKVYLVESLNNAISGKRTKEDFGSKTLSKLPDGVLYRLRDALSYSGKGNMFRSWYYTFAEDDFLPTAEMEFCGKKYPVPKNYDKLLRQVYGDYMQLPPEEKRIAHNPIRISFDLSLPDEELD